MDLEIEFGKKELPEIEQSNIHEAASNKVISEPVMDGNKSSYLTS